MKAPRILLAAMVGLVAAAGAQTPKLEFDVATVRINKSGPPEQGGDAVFSNVPMGPEETFRDTGGVFSARNTPLIKYISFAYKVTTSQREVFRASLPGWAMTENYNIEARTDNRKVTKDEMRRMMRSLLEERFRLKVRKETREVTVSAVMLAKPGRAGAAVAPASAG